MKFDMMVSYADYVRHMFTTMAFDLYKEYIIHLTTLKHFAVSQENKKVKTIVITDSTRTGKNQGSIQHSASNQEGGRDHWIHISKGT